MGMVKVFSPNGWNFDDQVASLVKIAAFGVGPNDRRDFVKRASPLFLPMLNDGSVKFAADEEPFHLLAVGATEAWGPNRNGDGFKAAVCREYHPTFVKFARNYRNHANKRPEISYGIVKASVYNEEMRRIELLCALNKTASAAERNGGFIADQELEKLARGEDIPVSMACQVPHDICSWCGNEAKTRSEYCKAATCAAGGCDENLTKLVKVAGQTHLVHVANVRPRYFDISKVYKPADRTAYGGRADWIKAAADGDFGVDGAKMAADIGVMAPMAVLLDQAACEYSPEIGQRIKFAAAFADFAELAVYAPNPLTKLAFVGGMAPAVNLAALGLDSDRAEKVNAGLSALASYGTVLPLRDFARMTKRAELADEAAPGLRGVYRRMTDDGSMPGRVASNRWTCTSKLASANQNCAALTESRHHGFAPDSVRDRCQRSGLRGNVVPNEKRATAALSPAAEDLVRDYACYKLAALCSMAEHDFDLISVSQAALAQDQAA